jgi:hypothetical protein
LKKKSNSGTKNTVTNELVVTKVDPKKKEVFFSFPTKPKRKYTKKADFWNKPHPRTKVAQALGTKFNKILTDSTKEFDKTSNLGSNVTQTAFTVRDICAIIETCHKSQVSKFNYRGLVLSFSDEEIVETLPGTAKHETEASTTKAPNMIAWGDEEQKRIDQAAMMQIEDPEAFEQAMMDADFARERALDERENHRGSQ